MSEAILDHSGIQQVLFHPRHDYGYTTEGAHPVSIELEPGVTIGGRLYPASATAPAMLYYHGNGEIAGDYDDIAGLYNQLGITLLVMDYRGYGTSTGTPTADNLVSDGPAVFERLDELWQAHGLTPERLYVMGRSLGSVPAIELAARYGDQLAGLLIESGFSDTFGLLARMGVRAQGAEEGQDGFGNAFKMERVTIPTLVLHGERDVLIPPSDGQALHDHCAAEDKRLVLIPNAGHNDIMLVGMKQYFEAIHMFVRADAR